MYRILMEELAGRKTVTDLIPMAEGLPTNVPERKENIIPDEDKTIKDSIVNPTDSGSLFSANTPAKTTDDNDVKTDITDLEIPTTGGEPIVVDEDVVLPMSMVDAMSVRLGAEWSAGEALDLRMGVLYESSAVPREYRGVLVADGPKLGLGAGATWRAGERLTLDVGLLRNQHVTQALDQSSLTQITLDPLSGAIGRGKAVGRGELGAASTLFGLSVIWRFAP